MIEVNADTFEKEVVQSELPVLVDFWGPRCVPCLALMPYVEGIEGKFEAKVKFTKIDASKNRRLCINLKVIDLPTYLFYKSGREVNRLKGDALTIEQIEEAAKKLTEKTIE